MKFIYFDCSAGASGDMILASLLSLGVSPDEFQRAIDGLKLKVQVKVRKARSGSLVGLRVEVLTPRNSQPRKFSEVEKIILDSNFKDQVKNKSLKIFKRLFEAESRVHGRSVRTTHLHEAAADDALVDIVGTCWLLEKLEVSSIYYSPVNLGSGLVNMAHGRLPVPAAAVAELMKGIPVYSTDESTELLTPTGAALLTGLGQCLPHWPELIYEKIGYGLGHKELKFQPNLLRAFYGPEKDFEPSRKTMVIEATIDDSSPHLLGFFLNRALTLGALEAYLTPVVMKKNRLGTKLTIIAETDKIDKLTEAVFKETTTIGLRYYPVERKILKRDLREVTVQGQKIRVKISYLEGKIVNVQPEYDDCLKAAEKLSWPLKKVINEALKKFD